MLLLTREMIIVYKRGSSDGDESLLIRDGSITVIHIVKSREPACMTKTVSLVMEALSVMVMLLRA